MTIGAKVRTAAAAGAAALLAVAAAEVRPGSAQTVQRLDQGTFELRDGGSRVGTETFAIRRERGSIRAVGQIQLDSAGSAWRPLRVWLQTNPQFRPQLFRLEPSDGGKEMSAAVRQDGRLRVQTVSGAGQRSREFLAPPELSVLHLDAAHHVYVLLRQHADALASEGEVRVPAVLPERRERVTLTIRRTGAEEITVAGSPRQAVRHVVEADGFRLEAWTDQQDRLLRVSYPEGRTAVRTQEGGA